MAKKESSKVTTPKEIEVFPLLEKTYLTILNYTLTKRIENISLLEKQKSIVDSKFCLDFNGEWYLEYLKDENDWFCFFLSRQAEQPLLTMEYKMIAYDFLGKEVCQKSSKISYDAAVKSYNLFPKGFREIAGLPGDGLLVVVKLEISLPPVSLNAVSSLNAEVLQGQVLSALRKNYKDLYTNRKYSDVTLIVKSKGRLSAHKCILSARSPVFARMFEEEGMMEQQDINIDDISLLTLNRLITFLYCGELEDYDFETAVDMYYAAVKYDVEDLRQYCVFKLVSNLTRLNAGSALIVAEEHRDLDLKDRVFTFLFQSYGKDQPGE